MADPEKIAALRVRIRMYAGHVPVAFGLKRPRRQHTLADFCTRLARLHPRQFLHRHGRDLDLDVDSVEERPRNAALVLHDVPCRATARMLLAPVIPARAGVHRRDKHEPRRIVVGRRRARNADMPVLERLSQDLKRLPWKLGELVEEEDSPVRQRDLARLRMCSAAQKTDRAHRMVRGTKGTARHECTAALRLASDGMDTRDLKRFLNGQRRKDGRDSPREQRLA